MSSTTGTELNNPRTLRGWALFDAANSAHALVLTAAIFPAYFVNVTDAELSFLGIRMANSTLYPYCISVSYLLVALLSPLLSGIADYGSRKKFFLKLFTTLGSVACMALFFFEGMDQLYLGTGAFALSLIGFAGCLVFYNAYMPLIATRDRFDRLSATGFAYGYAGSVLLLLANLALILNPHWIGAPDAGLPSRISFLSVGVWWLALSQITFRRLPADSGARFPRRALTMGYARISKVWRHLRQRKYIQRFLMAFFCYSLGVQTVILLAATFAENEMEFQSAELIILILIIQIVAIGGAFLFAFLSGRIGNKNALLAQLVIWLMICIGAYFITEKTSFYALAGAVGMVLGGIQSLSRSSYAKLIEAYPKDATSYFSFYDVFEKLGIVLGTFIFGLVSELTGNMRNSTLVLAFFFVAGILILSTVHLRKKQSSGQASTIHS